MGRSHASPNAVGVATRLEGRGREPGLGTATTTAVAAAAARRTAEGTGRAAATRACLGAQVKGTAIFAAASITTPEG